MEASDSEFSNLDLDLDEEALGMLADMALDEEIEDEVSIAD